jgi:hypothetical protein
VGGVARHRRRASPGRGRVRQDLQHPRAEAVGSATAPQRRSTKPPAPQQRRDQIDSAAVQLSGCCSHGLRSDSRNPPSGSTDTPIDLRFCRLSARSDRVVVSWCIRGASISTRCVPAVPVHSSWREGPKATASVISKRHCGGRRSPFDQQRPQVEPSGSPRANGSRSGMIPAMPQVRALGRIHSRWEHQRPARSPGHLVIEGVFRCR